MSLRAFLSLFLSVLGTIGCSSKSSQDLSNVSITPFSEIVWEKLNPARGDKSPQAGTLWGDRKGEVETAFLAKFVDGFSSPPHIHNVSYRAIVIEGLIHNDDPNATPMWMPKGSYWTQPAGEPHITSAKGVRNIALVEIDKGPYLVKPVKKQFDNGEKPYNIHASNILWKKQKNHKRVSLWKNKNNVVSGRLIEFSQKLEITINNSKIVTIFGNFSVNNQTLPPGSLVEVQDLKTLSVSCQTKRCVIYLKTTKDFKIS